MLAADVGEIGGGLSDVLHVFNVISGLAMGPLEVIAMAYMLDALRRTRATTTRKGKVRRNLRWWGILMFALGLLALTPFILSPYIMSRMQEAGMVDVLPTLLSQQRWAIAVTLAPIFIVGGVAFAQAGVVNVSSDSPARATTKARRSYVCPSCKKGFTTQQGLASHYRHYRSHSPRRAKD